ncbi:unnamed protein product [Scytosiphon promiscuus]
MTSIIDAAGPSESNGIQQEQEAPPAQSDSQQRGPHVPPADTSKGHGDDSASPRKHHRVRVDPVASPVTPQEVLTLGVLALAGLWPGCWSGIAAIISQKVELLAQIGAVDAPFRRCAQSLVDMLLRSPGEPSLAAETWQELASAQADLPDELGEMLGLACSLLQHRSFETADSRAKRKRRRASRLNTVAAVTAPVPRLAPICTTAIVNVVNDVARDEEEQEMENRRKRQREMERLAAPPLLPPSRVLPLLLRQPSPPAAPPPATAQLPQDRPPALPQPPAETDAECPVQPGLLDAAAPVLGGTEAEFPVLLPRSAASVGVPSPASPPASMDANGDHRGLQESMVPSPPQPHSPEEEHVVVG